MANTDRISVAVRGWFADILVGGHGIRLVFAGELDLATAPAFAAVLEGGLRPSPRQVVLDLGRVEFADLRTLKMIAAAHTRMGGSNGGLQVHGAKDAVRRLFDLCGLGEMVRPGLAVVPAPGPFSPGDAAPLAAGLD